MYAQFDVSEVTNLWQVTACGNVLGYPDTYGLLEVFVVDDANLQLALAGQPFSNCSCADVDDQPVSKSPVSSTCVTVEDDTEAPDENNALQCDPMFEHTDHEPREEDGLHADRPVPEGDVDGVAEERAAGLSPPRQATPPARLSLPRP